MALRGSKDLENLVQADVVFVDLPFRTYELGRRFKSAWRFKTSLSPYQLHLGFRYMVAALRARGHAAEILFPGLESGGATSKGDLLRRISRNPPRILGLTAYEGSLRETMQFIERARARAAQSLVCLGGHLATFSHREILRDFHHLVDVVVLGEGEETIVALAAAVREGRDFRAVPGMAYYDSGRVVTTAPRPAQAYIDRLPFAALPPTARWPNSDTPLFLITTRGCYGRCSFCRTSHFGDGWRARSAASVADEIEEAWRRGVTTFEIVDDNFIGPGPRGKARAAAVADELRRRRLDIRMHASCRVNDVDEETMRRLRDAGMISVSLGVESGVQRVLNTLAKGTTVRQNLDALHLLNRLGIPTTVYFIFFDPYLTLEEAAENVAFLKHVREIETVRFECVVFRKLIPVSGTAIFNRLQREGLLRGNYVDGHYFVFAEPRVAVLSDFMEIVELRLERLFARDEFRRIGGLYEAMKTRFEFSFAEKAIDLLASARWKRAEALRRLEILLSDELKGLFGRSLANLDQELVTHA